MRKFDSAKRNALSTSNLRSKVGIKKDQYCLEKGSILIARAPNNVAAALRPLSLAPLRSHPGAPPESLSDPAVWHRSFQDHLRYAKPRPAEPPDRPSALQDRSGDLRRRLSVHSRIYSRRLICSFNRRSCRSFNCC